MKINGCGILEKDVAQELQRKLLPLRVNISRKIKSQEERVSRREALTLEGLRAAKEMKIPPIFLARASGFYPSFFPEIRPHRDQVLLVGLHVYSEAENHMRCGLMVYGEDVRTDLFSSGEQVCMSVKCEMKTTMFSCRMPRYSKVIEVLMRPLMGFCLSVTLPERCEDMIERTWLYISFIEPEIRFFS